MTCVATSTRVKTALRHSSSLQTGERQRAWDNSDVSPATPGEGDQVSVVQDDIPGGLGRASFSLIGCEKTAPNILAEFRWHREPLASRKRERKTGENEMRPKKVRVKREEQKGREEEEEEEK
ncbi:hypothetical protein CROQUDRAFT_86454 [Cronartium quercuum f. sp. fusiforme G11]|uniref:Uncharacterized protein n=1 Tax=Cronartium quercuum f. sp. fusiforme G11 TaxID=708437 RepID=A0A9P6NR29_9BASI|nr:hypothetical protein CROQUDRAFT_86454 [Cronartium quercuum f. sp. fusiforme G11]